MSTLYQHFFLSDSANPTAYASIPRPVRSPVIPEREREQHAAKLQRNISDAWQQAQQTGHNRSAVLLPTREGMYLEFTSKAGADLVTKSLENIRSGIRLLSVRFEGDPQMTIATVYIPKGREKFFLNKVHQYAEKETKNQKPKNQPLVNSIEDIRLAVLESFWQDERQLVPGDIPAWCEVWLRGDDEETEQQFRRLLSSLNINCETGTLYFPERMVLAILVTALQLSELIEISDTIAEFRRVKETARFFLEMENKDQTAWVKNLLGRLNVQPASRVAVCVLDTGINNAHPLIRPLLADEDCQGSLPDWGVNDHDGHGTLMAGIAAYGNLQTAIESQLPVYITHCLESVKILPPKGQNDPKLFGHVTQRAISKAEIASSERTHITCMAVTATDSRDQGRPSSWSAAIDSCTFGYSDQLKRLCIIAAGNVSGNDEWCGYPDSNLTNAVHDPGQAWNALTVGAYTEKSIISDIDFAGYTPLAQSGELSPHSTTSLAWENNKWPIKPEIVLEGGNLAKSPEGTFISECDDLSILSTSHLHTKRQFHSLNATSAATAQAANMAARIQVAYPQAWPESVRGLLVHSARWTPAMQQQFLRDESKSEYAKLLRICGYGVPDLTRALESAANSLTLIAQENIQPFYFEPDLITFRISHFSHRKSHSLILFQISPLYPSKYA